MKIRSNDSPEARARRQSRAVDANRPTRRALQVVLHAPTLLKLLLESKSETGILSWQIESRD